jgi:hypothetical protein
VNASCVCDDLDAVYLNADCVCQHDLTSVVPEELGAIRRCLYVRAATDENLAAILCIERGCVLCSFGSAHRSTMVEFLARWK